MLREEPVQEIGLSKGWAPDIVTDIRIFRVARFAARGPNRRDHLARHLGLIERAVKDPERRGGNERSGGRVWSARTEDDCRSKGMVCHFEHSPGTLAPEGLAGQINATGVDPELAADGGDDLQYTPDIGEAPVRCGLRREHKGGMPRLVRRIEPRTNSGVLE